MRESRTVAFAAPGRLTQGKCVAGVRNGTDGGDAGQGPGFKPGQPAGGGGSVRRQGMGRRPWIESEIRSRDSTGDRVRSRRVSSFVSAL